jgi:hypothetical protein
VATPANPTGHGVIHALSGLAVFISLPIATFVMTRRFAGDPAWRGWVLYSLLTGIIMIASFVIFQVLGSMDQTGTIQNAPIGLVQRIAIVAGWVWVSLLAIALLRKGRARSDDRLHPSLNLAGYGLVFLPACTRRWTAWTPGPNRAAEG